MQLKPQKWVLLLHMSCSGVHFLLETLPMFGPGTTQKLMAIVFLYCYIVSWVSYYKTATTEPGSPPDGWVTDVPYPESKELLQHGEAAESAPILAYSQEFGSLRFCRVCRNWKPERCHHCRKCARCRLKMDHHCPWTDSCIGYYNYKYYCLLVLYGLVCILMMLVTQFSLMGEPQAGTLHTFMFCVNLAMALFVGSLVGFHAYIMAIGITTIEHRERTKPGIEIGRYDRGSLYDNLCDALGPPQLWLLPTRAGMHGNGLRFDFPELSTRQ